MKNYVRIFSTLLVITAVAYAGGAASLAAKKSNSKDFTFSSATQLAFMNDCSQGANRQVCGCILDKLQKQYSERTYLQLDSDLRKDIENKEFVDFITNAAESCDAMYASAAAKASAPAKASEPAQNAPAFVANEEAHASIAYEDSDIPNVAPIPGNVSLGVQPTYQPVQPKGKTEAEAREYIAALQKEKPRTKFVPECSVRTKDYLGEKAANKICGCAYDRITANIPKLTKKVMEEGSLDESGIWALEYAIDCVPEKFTPDVEKSMISYLNNQGLPKSMGQCVVKTLKKEFSLRNLMSSIIGNTDGMAGIITTLLAKCLLN